MKKRLISLILSLSFVFSVLGITVCAAETEVADSKTEVTYFADGSYLVTIITEEPANAQARGVTQTKNGQKSTYYYSSTNKLLCSLTVYGTFTYDGTTARATNASYSYTVDHSFWSFDSGTTAMSGAKVVATAVFKYLSFVQTKSLSVTLTCSPTGSLS